MIENEEWNDGHTKQEEIPPFSRKDRPAESSKCGERSGLRCLALYSTKNGHSERSEETKEK